MKMIFYQLVQIFLGYNLLLASSVLLKQIHFHKMQYLYRIVDIWIITIPHTFFGENETSITFFYSE